MKCRKCSSLQYEVEHLMWVLYFFQGVDLFPADQYVVWSVRTYNIVRASRLQLKALLKMSEYEVATAIVSCKGAGKKTLLEFRDWLDDIKRTLARAVAEERRQADWLERRRQELLQDPEFMDLVNQARHTAGLDPILPGCGPGPIIKWS